KRAYCLKTQPATGETYPKSDLFNKAFIGFNSVLFNCHIQTGCVIRYNAVVDGVTLPENTYIPSTERVGPDSDLKSYSKVDPASLQFSEEVASTNVKLVEGYQLLRNEF
ncbi:hypothetical protein LNV56_27415, partial [Klebsiella pneumoniae]|nr:hypothetical protein [Klebsiella pneumoniae]